LKMIDLHTKLLVVQPTKGCLQDVQVSVEFTYVWRDVKTIMNAMAFLANCWSS
jgi:hypothetical protein